MNLMFTSYDDFDRLDVFTRISGYLINETPTRIGVGREPPLGSAVDIAPLRVLSADGKLVPFIPGSSIKGVLRSLAESILRAQEINVHDPWDMKQMELEAKDGRFCIICGTFGSIKLASHVHVYDVYPVGQASTFIKTGIGINRDFRGVQPGAFYTEEQVIPRVKWSLTIDIINIRVFPESSDERGRILRNLLQLLKAGYVKVGARRTVGYGLLRLVEGRYEVFESREGFLLKTSEGEI